MRITTANLVDFFVALNAEEKVFQDVIRLSISRQKHDPSGKSPGMKFLVVLQVSALVECGDGSQYLLECGQDCGKDYNEAVPVTDGSDQAQALRAEVVSYAAGRGWRVLPGVIGI